MGKKVVVSAPGKLMLLGEHAVLYSKPCLVTAVDKRVYATVEIIDKQEFQLEAVDVKVARYKKPLSDLGKGDIPKGAQFVEMAIANTLELNSKFLLRHSGPLRPRSEASLSRISQATAVGDSGVASLPRMTVGVRVVTKSEFSPKLGFGSSSTVTVCIIKAISELFNLNLSKKQMLDLAYKTILDIQDKGSGFDVAAAVYGGTLYFVTGGKLIESLDIKSLPLVVGYSGIKADTVSVINKVKKIFANRQNRLDEIYNGIKVLVNQGKETLIKTDWKRLGILMNQNQDYLCELGVSIDKLDIMIKAALTAGAYGAKLSGAGGGDCMIALVSGENRKKVAEAISKAGGGIIDIKTGAEGVRTD